MATAWYRPGFVPKIVKSWKLDSPLAVTVELWNTTCIVTNFGKARCRTLIVPANPRLSGVNSFPYFPIGGPEPSLPPTKDAHPIMGFVTQWGGMDAGSGLMYAANTVDGLVHQAGGKQLAAKLKTALDGRERIDEGQAAYTRGVGDYEHLIHTVPPFFQADDSQENRLLQNSYQSALQVAAAQLPSETDTRIACPLLGAGCRGFPSEEAIFHCAEGLSDLDMETTMGPLEDQSEMKRFTLAFGVPSSEIREQMIDVFDNRTSFIEI